MKLVLDKVTVARRQLRQCIQMFFARSDAVAVHTLACASRQILYDLAKVNGHHGLIRRHPVVREDKLKEWNNYLNVPQNFFKHADRDPDSTAEFETDITEIFILDSVVLLQSLGIELRPAERVYSIWFALKHPTLLRDGVYKDQIAAGLYKGINVNDYETVNELLRHLELVAQ